MSTPRYTPAGVPKSSVLSSTLYNVYINDIPPPQTSGENLALFEDDTCLYVTDRKEGHVLRKIYRELNSMAAWYERWNIQINEEKTWAIYFTLQNRPPDFLHTLNGQNIPYVNSVKYSYLGANFDRKMTEITHRDDRSQCLQNIRWNIFPTQK
jgi:hypothetical protein